MMSGHFKTFGSFIAGWIAASAIGWSLGFPVVGVGIGFLFGLLIIQKLSYSDDKLRHDLYVGFAHVDPQKRLIRGQWVALAGVTFATLLIAVPMMTSMADLEYATPALGGLAFPYFLNFYFRLRQMTREGSLQ